MVQGVDRIDVKILPESDDVASKALGRVADPMDQDQRFGGSGLDHTGHEPFSANEPGGAAEELDMQRLHRAHWFWDRGPVGDVPGAGPSRPSMPFRT